MRDMLCLTCGTNGLLLAPLQAKVEMQRASLFETPGSLSNSNFAVGCC